MRSTLTRSAQCECARMNLTNSSPRTTLARHVPVASNIDAFVAQCSVRSTSADVTVAKRARYVSTMGCQSGMLPVEPVRM